jgi:nucleoside-diphosphate-sugar epimerase
MRVFITGATGYLGEAVALASAAPDTPFKHSRARTRRRSA